MNQCSKGNRHWTKITVAVL